MLLFTPLMRVGALLLLLIGVAAGVSLNLRAPHSTLAVPTLRHPSAHRSIEWRREESRLGRSLSLLVHAGRHEKQRTILFPFELDVTVGEVLRSRLPRALMPVSAGERLQCQLVGAGDEPLSDSASLAGALTSLSLSNGENVLTLRCTLSRPSGLSKRRWFGFHSHVEPTLMPNEVRAANLARRAALNQQADYPMESAELISNNWEGLIGWVTSWIKHHVTTDSRQLNR